MIRLDKHMMMPVSRVVCAVLLGALLCLPAPAGAAETKRANVAPALVSVIAVIPPDAPPTYYRDMKTGAPSGFSVDIMNEVARRAGLKVEYVFEYGWSEIIAMVRDGKADLAPGMGISRDRSQVLAFSAFIDAFPISFFVREESEGLDALPGRHLVGAVQGSVTAEYLREQGDIKLVLYESYQRGFLDLLSGKLDAFASPAPTLWQIAREAKVEGRIKVVDKPVTEIRRGIAVRKTDRALLDRLNGAVRGYVGTPAYQQVYTKWYGKPVPYWTEGRIIMAGALIAVFIVLVMAAWRYVSLVRVNRELQKALAEIKTLRGILPICSSCKRIRDEKGAWHQMEAYIHEHTAADFSHGICTDCANRLYPDYVEKQE